MKSSTERKKRRSSNESITKLIPYGEYLQLKNAYIELKEKFKKMKEEKQKIELLLKEYQKYINDYKSSNNTIKILFQKVENNYKQLNIQQKYSFKNIYIIRAVNFKIIKKEKNIKLNEKRYTLQFYDSNEKEETFRKTISYMSTNNDIITKEYNKTIDRYIEVINQLNKEIKLKDNLLINRNFENNSKTKDNYYKLNKIFHSLIISNNVCDYNIIPNKGKIKKLNLHNKFENKLSISSNTCRLSLLKSKKEKSILSTFENKLLISSNICKFNLFGKIKSESEVNNYDNILSISSNVCEFTLFNDIKNIIKENNFNGKIFISSNVSNFNILENIDDKKIINIFGNKLIISSNVCEYNILTDNSKKYNEKLNISSNICEINILKENQMEILIKSISVCTNIIEIMIQPEEKKNILNTKYFNNLILESDLNNICILQDLNNKSYTNIISNEIEVNIFPSRETSEAKLHFKNLNIAKNINEINIKNNKKIKEELYIVPNNIELSLISNKKSKEIIYTISNNLNICLLSHKKSSNLLSNQKLNIESKVNNIYYENEKKIYFENLLISSKINEIKIIISEKDINLEICSNISEIIILPNKMKKEKIYEEEKECFQINRIKSIKNGKANGVEKSILENYINTINLGFDNNKKYDNFNFINNEKDEDSDNENDKLECEPVPSFILCIQKMNKISEK